MSKLFISYRREDSQHQADRLHAALSRKMPKKNIFIDVDNIPVGVNFVQHLDQQVAQCDVLLALIGPDWLEAKNPETGKRRLDDPKDFVRIEIASALKRGIPVAPILLDGAPFPAEASLPDDLKALTLRNGVEVRRMSFDADAERLIRGLNLTRAAAAAKPSAPSRSPAPAGSGRSSWMGPAIALGLLGLGGGAYAWFGNPGDWRGVGAITEEAASSPEDPTPVDIAAADPAPATPLAAAETAAETAAPQAPADDPAARTAAVKRLQQALKTLGSYSGAADGRTGTATSTAAKTFASAQRVAAPDLAAAPLAEVEAFAARAEQAALVWTTQEIAAWRVAKDADTRAPLDAYLRDFPNGPNASAARARITALTRPAATVTTPAASAPAVTASAPRAGESFRDCSVCPQMVSIPSGSFLMGSPASEAGRFDNEGPQRRVSVPAFAAGRYEVTWTEYGACVSAGACPAANDDGFGKGSRPVTNVSWEDAKKYVAWLSRETGKTYRLLSEAEWEYAARAGTTAAYWWGGGASHEYANYGKDACCDGLASGSDRWVNTSPAGSFPANGFGLHDMHGNVWEWVEDCIADNYSAGQPTDGRAFTQGNCSYRVFRGGSWYNHPRSLRSAIRYGLAPSYRSGDLGFRVARTL